MEFNIEMGDKNQEMLLNEGLRLFFVLEDKSENNVLLCEPRKRRTGR